MATMSSARSRSLPPSQAGVRSRLSLFREPGTAGCHWVLGSPSHRNVAAAFCRRTLLRRSSPGDGEGRPGLTHCFAPLLKLQVTRRLNSCRRLLLIGYLGKDPEMKYTPGGTAIT